MIYLASLLYSLAACGTIGASVARQNRVTASMYFSSAVAGSSFFIGTYILAKEIVRFAQ